MPKILEYRFFKWGAGDNLIYVGSEVTHEMIMPGAKFALPDVDGLVKDWIVLEVHFPNPREVIKPDGSKYCPDPIVILKVESWSAQ